ncbi:MAG: hypothetical protein FWD40_09975 [Treponema sp.]|nr:hypothetical protein [Treponema sp.]
MNYKAISDLHKRNKPFSMFNFIMFVIGLGQTAGAAAIFVFGIVPVIQGKNSFEIIILPMFLLFGAAGLGLLSFVVIQIVKYKRCFILLKNGSNGRGTYLASDHILINHDPFYRIKYSFRDENNRQHEVKTRYIYFEHEMQELQQMSTFPVKYHGKHAVIAWVDEQLTYDDAAAGCFVTRKRRVVITLNIIFGVIMLVSLIGTIAGLGTRLFNNSSIDTAFIIVFIFSIFGIAFTNVAAAVIRKMLLIKDAVLDIKNSGTKPTISKHNFF